MVVMEPPGRFGPAAGRLAERAAYSKPKSLPPAPRRERRAAGFAFEERPALG